MSDLDDLLADMRNAPAPARLSALDALVMTGLARRRETIEARRGLALAGAIAIVVGVGGALVPGTPAAAEPLLGLPSAAPSHLLAD
jgi:hypothetical protein